MIMFGADIRICKHEDQTLPSFILWYLPISYTAHHEEIKICPTNGISQAALLLLNNIFKECQHK